MSQIHGENGVSAEIRLTKGCGGKGWYGTVWLDDRAVFSAAGYDLEADLDARLERFVERLQRSLKYKANGTGRRSTDLPVFKDGN